VGSATGSSGTLGTASHLLIKLSTAGVFSLAKTLGNVYYDSNNKLTDISAAAGGGLRIIGSVFDAFDIGSGITAHGTDDANGNAAMAIFTVTTDCEPSAFPADTTAPTISSASRTDNTHITVTLSGLARTSQKQTTAVSR
jgi:hypothetical protein